MSRQTLMAAVLVATCSASCPIRGAEEKLLCPEGTWKGTCRGWPRAEDRTLQVELHPGFIALMEGDQGVVRIRNWVDQGCGHCRWKNARGEGAHALGIYKWKGGRLLICFREPGKGRPKEFSSDGGQILITVAPVQDE
jgi:hypothetical protein